MDQKLRGLLAYLFGWLGGLIILLVPKDNTKETNFHCAQSIVISVSAWIISIVLGFIPYVGFLGTIVSLAAFALRIIGMVKAYKEEPYELPVISDFTRNLFKDKVA